MQEGITQFQEFASNGDTCGVSLSSSTTINSVSYVWTQPSELSSCSGLGYPTKVVLTLTPHTSASYPYYRVFVFTSTEFTKYKNGQQATCLNTGCATYYSSSSQNTVQTTIDPDVTSNPVVVLENADQSYTLYFSGTIIFSYPSCSSYSSCSSCTDYYGCGYCQSSSSCVRGKSSGPYSGSCSTDSWAYYESACSSLPPSFSIGGILGVAIGVFGVVVVVLIIICCCCCAAKRKKQPVPQPKAQQLVVVATGNVAETAALKQQLATQQAQLQQATMTIQAQQQQQAHMQQVAGVQIHQAAAQQQQAQMQAAQMQQELMRQQMVMQQMQQQQQPPMPMMMMQPGGYPPAPAPGMPVYQPAMAVQGGVTVQVQGVPAAQHSVPIGL
eukprot:GAFH01001734.1.p1 GENE.GAFH01001734.1~~GAFH01001734.1.p1  ORF type:complete len:407 (+),score=55.38 GAFH01001734.1:71-1222(+)